MILSNSLPQLKSFTSLKAIKEEDKEYAEVKQNLRSEIREMRRKLKIMMKGNEKVADIEKLNHYEFDLDMEEQRRLQAEGEENVTRVINLSSTIQLEKKRCFVTRR